MESCRHTILYKILHKMYQKLHSTFLFKAYNRISFKSKEGE